MQDAAGIRDRLLTWLDDSPPGALSVTVDRFDDALALQLAIAAFKTASARERTLSITDSNGTPFDCAAAGLGAM